MAKKKSAKKRSSDSERCAGFEASLAEVEQIVAQLEGGELGLTESLQHYETGIKHLKRCHELLVEAEQRVTLLSGFDADGNSVAEPLRDVEGELGNRRGKAKRTRSARQEGGQDAVNGGSDAPSVDDPPGLF